MNNRFRKVVQAAREGWKSGKESKDEGDTSRFVMKPGEVRVIRGGGKKVDRAPGEPRGQ